MKRVITLLIEQEVSNWGWEGGGWVKGGLIWSLGKKEIMGDGK